MLKNLEFDYEESMNQDGLFTMHHVKYDVLITRKDDDRELYFDFQCNPTYVEPTLEGCLECCLLDAYNVEGYSLDDFAEEFGITKPSEAIKVYEGCKRNYEKLHAFFTDAEIEELEEEILY